MVKYIAANNSQNQSKYLKWINFRMLRILSITIKTVEGIQNYLGRMLGGLHIYKERRYIFVNAISLSFVIGYL